jgi:hypothetical protein
MTCIDDSQPSEAAVIAQLQSRGFVPDAISVLLPNKSELPRVRP